MISRCIVRAYMSPFVLATLKTAIENDLPNVNRIQDIPRNWIEQKVNDTTICVTFDVRLKATTDGDTLWNKWQSKLALLPAGITGTISYHQCTHEDPETQPCVGFRINFST